MKDIYLTRVDSEQNMARFYRMSLQPTLFGEWAVVREWGRIGRGGQVKAVAFATEAEADTALRALSTTKLRKGYSCRRKH
ncbi:WGR domain-containing protein [Rhizobium rhizoryzae]|uniref:WGR domain-containing protein n=1 Tax=Rhizobium rhizoryzae TaxID=451876 RepID=UPI0028AF77E5|nr:WGR domain-containing protein [Rhizobium rhizoryzae]